MVHEAESHAAEDRGRRDEVEVRNQADQMIYEAEKVLKDNAERIPADVKSEAEGKLQALRDATKESDSEALRKAMDEFNEVLQKVGQHIYAKTGASGGESAPPGASGEKKEDGDVVDADYREVN
jgi:molecular chaperone DnaK